MSTHRLLVTGPSGAGSTTLGRALATLWAVPHADVDDYLWMPGIPPYTHKRPVEDRLALMEALFVPRSSWVLSGTLRGWGDPVIAQADGVVFLTIDPEVRMERLMRREVVRYGEEHIGAGGALEAAHQDFMDWARAYEDTEVPARQAKDERWLAGLTCPVLRLDSAAPLEKLVTGVTDWFGGGDAAGRTG
ncbi:AAA family ATPase [Streptomyces vinaceus]|uniref:AAA family ATPase n=1 Tax=Streptomyces vinaceus TaxID=1960 RepID=UPI0036B66029